LDISKQLAQMHGGDLMVESQVGKGSTFSFTLQLATEAQLEAQPVTNPLEESESAALVLNPSTFKASEWHTILIIEDEARIRDMMRNILELAGYAVTETHDGKQGVDLAIGLIPDVIILDIFLHDMDGWAVLQELRTCPSTAAIPVIVCTVSEEQEKAAELGATAYLENP